MKKFRKNFLKKMRIVSYEDLIEFELVFHEKLKKLEEENLILKNRIKSLTNEIEEVEKRNNRIIKKVNEYLKSLEKGLTLLQTNSLICDLKSIIITKRK